MCGDRPTSDEDRMNDDSEAAIDSVEAVGFSTRCYIAHTLAYSGNLYIIIGL